LALAPVGLHVERGVLQRHLHARTGGHMCE
jgi:hypothetical protein